MSPPFLPPQHLSFLLELGSISCYSTTNLCLRQNPSPFISLRLSSLSSRNGSELIRSGAWKDASFKNYNFAAAGQLPEGGALHPLLKMREEMRQIFFDMGYVSLLPCLLLISPTFRALFISLKKAENKEMNQRKGRRSG